MSASALRYFLFAGVVLTGGGVAQWNGWSLLNRVDRVSQVPKSVRDNPGIYRSIYTFNPRYSGGK